MKGVVVEIKIKEFTESGKKLGFIDFKVDCNLVGTKRSCIQYYFAMVGNIYGHNIKDELYKDFPPHTYTDTLLLSFLQSQAVKTNFRFYKVTEDFKMNGQLL